MLFGRESGNMKREVKTKVLLDNSNLIKRSETSYQQIHEGFFRQNWEWEDWDSSPDFHWASHLPSLGLGVLTYNLGT